MMFIRQGATHKVVVGPFVDKDDGLTPETGITLSGADEAEAILHDNGTVVDISGYTWAAITTADGYYHLTLQSGISGTVGHLTIVVNDDSVCLPVRMDFTVLEEAAYDLMYASGATGVPSDMATATALTTVDTVVDGIQTDLDNGTDGLGALKALIDALNDLSAADVNAEVDTALSDIGLDHLLAAAVVGADVTDNSVIAKLVSASATADWDDFVNTTDALQAIRDHIGDGTNLTEAGGDGDHLTEAGGTGDQLTAITALLPAALVGGRIDANVGAISADATAADRLEAMMDGIIIGQVNDAAATTTAFAADGFTEATDDHFNGRLITFISGALAAQQTDISDYDAAGHAQGSQAFVVTALTEAPANNDFFVVH